MADRDKLVKVQITGDLETLQPGTIVGLSTKMADEFIANELAVKLDEPHHQRITNVAQVGKGAVFWVEENKRPKGSRIIPMPRGYMEDNPISARKREEFLAAQKGDNTPAPAKAISTAKKRM